MSAHDTLLVEIGTEELPPKALRRLSEAFATGIGQRLHAAGFGFSATEAYATPRRLAVCVRELACEQPDRVETRRGPALTVAFDANGEPSKAAVGFARSCGVTVAELGRLTSADGSWLAFEQRIAGRRLVDFITEVVSAALADLPIPKRMRWGDRSAEFVRPVHWIVMLYGADVVEGEVFDLRAGRLTRGHRFHHPQTLELAHANDYAARLEHAGRVIASFAQRRARIQEQAQISARAAGGDASIEPELLDEVTALVEWPVAISGSFEQHFLHLPPEVLVATMQDHQKYFPVRDEAGRLCNRFVTMSNIESLDPQAIRSGNERVIRPRLNDADFFFRKDRQQRLDGRLGALDSMLFEKRLGSLGDKTRRVETLARLLAPACAASADLAARAATLSRCDLLSEMVGEFPELQGTMGSYYAAADGEAAEVCFALAEFYRPRFSGDDIPGSAVGRAIALADKLDSLIGIFGIGSAPTGDRDPFALRRAAIGVLRILIEADIEVDLRVAIDAGCAAYAGISLLPDVSEQVYAYIRERMRGYYIERGVPADVCDAVLANDPAAPAEVARRLDAVRRFRDLGAAHALAAANKRIANILKKLEVPPPQQIEADLLTAAQECALAAQYTEMAGTAEHLFESKQYGRYMELLATLRDPVDAFFDGVMVMSEDKRVRDNRLALLARLHALFTRVADIARLHDT